MNRPSVYYGAARRKVQISRTFPHGFSLVCKPESQLPISNGAILRLQQFGTNKDDGKKGQQRQGKSQRVKKENFAKKFLEPAARGELTKHSSGIPKLAARKTKGHVIKDDFPGKEANEIITDSMNYERSDSKRGKSVKIAKKLSASEIIAAKTQDKRREELEAIFQGPTPEDLNPDLKANWKWIGERSAMQQSSFQQRRHVGGRGGGRGEIDPNSDVFGDSISKEERDDPWETYTLEFNYDPLHAESRREAKPIQYPPHRVNPSDEFLKKNGFTSFAYVNNVPRPVVDGELGVYDNPMHRHEVAEFVADVFSVPISSVFPATMSSAFIGFKNAAAAADATIASEAKRIITLHKIEASRFSLDNATEEEKNFASEFSDSCIKVDHIPAGKNAESLSRLLNPAVTVDPKKICFTSVTSALVRLSSPEEAEILISNGSIEKTLSSTQRQFLRVFPAAFDTVHDRYGGVMRLTQLKKKTSKLVVHGDVPSSKFLMSHGAVLHLSNTPHSMSKKEISAVFQKYCAEVRDVEGSIEFVKSIDGHPNGRVYVGFDLASEGKVAWEEIRSNGQQIMFSETEPAARVMEVHEKALVRGSKLGARSERSAEDLVASLSEWKNWIDPADLKELESFGVTIDILEESFSATRRNNPTFSVEDQAREGERMRDEKKPGEHFAEFVQDYIGILKELSTTRENPGLKYESMFMPEEEVDLELFDAEQERVAALAEEFASTRVEE